MKEIKQPIRMNLQLKERLYNMDFSEYLFRCHMVGKIIDIPKPLTPSQKETLANYTERNKGIGRALTIKQIKDLTSLQHKQNESEVYKLSDSTKKILSELTFAEKYNRKVDINSPKLTKGIEVEKNSRDILTRVSNIFLTASDERKNNKWVTGKIDVEPSNVIIDIKSSWSWESFSKILEAKTNEIYLRQGDSYMDLWGVDEFLLCHVLTDTPHRLVESEIKRYDWNHNILNVEGEIREENIEDAVKIITNHIFSRKSLEEFCHHSPIIHIEWFVNFKEIPEHERVHMIPHSFDKVRIEQRNECIALAREYMKNSQAINNFNPELISA